MDRGGSEMKVGKREKGKIYASRGDYHVFIYKGQKTLFGTSFCYIDFARITGIKLKPGQMIEIEVRAIGGVG